jgi:hypothetical protein
MTTMPAGAFLVLILLITAVAALASLVSQKQRAMNLKCHFGPEYDHAVFEMLRSKRNADSHRVGSVSGSAYADRIS